MKKEPFLIIIFCIISCCLICGCQEPVNLIEQAINDEGAVITKGDGTVYIHNITYSADASVAGDYIVAENITVRNGAKLTLAPTADVTILAPFSIEANCAFEIHY